MWFAPAEIPMARSMSGGWRSSTPVAIARATGLAKHSQLMAVLKSEHALTHGYANQIAQQALRPTDDAPEGDDLLTAQYAGKKAPLKPIYEALAKAIAKFGKDVEFSPKKTYVSLRRTKQFALIQPTSAVRLDVGINLKDALATKRLELSGSFNAMVSHRVRVATIEEVDAELLAWLRQAYSLA